MDRRAFLKTGIAASAAASLPWRVALAADEWRTYEVLTKIELSFPKGVSRVWLPLPLVADTEWHRGLGNSWSGNASRAQVASDGKYGASMLYAEWAEGPGIPQLEVTSREPKTIRADDLAAKALEVMETWQITSLVIVDPGRRPTRVAPLNVQRCERERVVHADQLHL